MLRISIDLMGGDNAPLAILEAASKFKDLHFVFVGNSEAKKQIKNYNLTNYDFIECENYLQEGKRINHADLVVSSMHVAIEQVKLGNADAVVSAGPSGYYMLLAKSILGTIANLKRPALAAMIPNIRSFSVMLDLGANITCDAYDLAKFAIMGSALAKFWLNVEIPKVGFLNVGSELGKGPENVKQALDLFDKIHPGTSDFAEGHYVMSGDYDVIVADGFVGNAVLKFAEGMMRYVKAILKQTLTSNMFSKILAALLRNRFKKALIDPRKLNGAVFAGINGCVVKSHGSSDSLGFESAINVAAKIASRKEELLGLIAKELQQCDLQKLS